MSTPRQQLQHLQQQLATRFWRNEPIEALTQALTAGLDEILTTLFETHLSLPKGITLYAVGGYGRSEMYPGSDIDLLVLADKPEKYRGEIAAFVQSVYDLNVEVGHSVRDVKSCRTEAHQDITVATALFERRLITGDAALAGKLDKTLSHRRLWPAQQFFEAKLNEQQQRHKDYDHVEYNLEPNIKTSPGGLRDIHTAMWITQRAFGTHDPEQLVDLGVITPVEKHWLIEGHRFLSWVRFGLHLIAQRKDDRLQFDYQRELAQRLGFVDTDAQRGVERFMHHYYRHVLALTEVNDIIIQHLTETQSSRKRAKTELLSEDFCVTNDYIEITTPDVFKRKPAALLQLFVIMANRKDIAGVRASTIRAMRDHLDLIDDDYRNNPEHNTLFLDLLKAPYTLVSTLTRMRRYGVLGRYIPEFGRVVGQMQHDLFHIYTVDAHTMMVIRNMRRFRYRSSAQAYPVAYHSVHTVPKIELLYISGLYHDIGKGRGGDHSELGAEDARAFCQRHALNTSDTELVCWLVEKHLYMSSVAQREDIYDPEVVSAFADEVKSEMRLDYLYALTVADINATNPTLWNSWRATLLHQLYNATRKLLRRGTQSTLDRQDTIIACQETALERVLKLNSLWQEADIEALWEQLGDDFFLRHNPPQVANLTAKLLAHDIVKSPYIEIQNTDHDLPGEGATHIYVYCQDRPELFANTVLALSQFQLSIVDATVATSENNLCFDCYTVLDDEGKPLPRDNALREQISTALRKAITEGAGDLSLPQRRLPRQLRQLPRPTTVDITPTTDGQASVLTLVASDRPGLLATIAALFSELNLSVLSAKITTLGERVEDTFIIQSSQGSKVTAGETTYSIENTLRQRLDQELGVNNKRRSRS